MYPNTPKQKFHYALILIAALAVVYFPKFKDDENNIWGDEPEESYITITGSKPADAKAKAWAAFTVSGDECENYSYDLFGRKAHRGGKYDESFTHDFSKTPDRYELRLPFKPVYDDDHCVTKLRDFRIYFYNDFSGFGGFNFSPSGKQWYNKPIPSNSLIESKNCDARIYHNNLGWFGGISCELFVNGKSRANNRDLQNIGNYDFSKFTDSTVIEYNVYAGEKYVSEALDKKLGPSEAAKKAVVDS